MDGAHPRCRRAWDHAVSRDHVCREVERQDRLLEVLELLVAKPWLTGSVSAAVLARKVHQVRPTLLLDESDAAFKGEREYAEALRGVLNSGFKASGSYSAVSAPTART